MKLKHKELHVYQLSLKTVKDIYELSSGFPSEEKFGLSSQLRRAAVSICSNIAEGSARISGNERKRFYEISRSSCVEVDTQIEIALMLNYTTTGAIKEVDENMLRIYKMLSNLIRSTT